MLCQILQTEDINAVQAWLCSAGERGNELIEMLRLKSTRQNKFSTSVWIVFTLR